MSHNDNFRGVLIMLGAVGLLSLMDAGLKVLAPHYPPLQVAALRGAASLPFAFIWVATTVGFRSLAAVRWKLHLLRGILAILMLSLFAYALRGLPLSTAYTLFFVAPLMITALSGPVLDERVGRGRWAAILIGLAGTLIVLRPSPHGVSLLPALAVLGAAAGYAASAVAVRVLARTDSTQSMVFWVLLMLTVGAGALALPGWVEVRTEHIGAIIAVGVCGALGQYAITEAFARGEASVIAPFEYSALGWGLMLDLWLWGVLPDGATLLGAAVIVASGVYLLRQESRPIAAGPEDQTAR